MKSLPQPPSNERMKKIATTMKSILSRSVTKKRQTTAAQLGGYELLEGRCLLATDILQLGVVYTESDFGSDASGDTLEITFNQGAPDTELTRLIIHGDHNQIGYDAGDIIFDIQDHGLGADQSFPFTIAQMSTQYPGATVTATVQDGSSTLILDFKEFVAGDRVVLELDVDEVEIDLHGTDAEKNEGIDPITSGIEFQGVRIVAEFSAKNYRDSGAMAVFRNSYDATLEASGLDLPKDNENEMRDRTAAAFVSVVQTPLPVRIAGSVFVDIDNNQQRDEQDYALEDVQIELWKFESGSYIPTGKTSTTDASGAYDFGGLEVGIYEVREIQPIGLIDSAGFAGQLNGGNAGIVLSPNVVSEIVVSAGGSEVTDVDFAETDWAEIRGVVSSATDGPIGDVTVQLICNDGDLVRTTVTDEAGVYVFEEVTPGSCWIHESTPAGFLDGPDFPGTVNGSPQGESDGLDSLGPIHLVAGDEARQYNFSEIRPAALTGVVFRDGDSYIVHTEDDVRFRGNRQLDRDDMRIAGVELILINHRDGTETTARTNHRGEFAFRNLEPGQYSLHQVQPVGYYDGPDYAGSHRGLVDSAADTIHQIDIREGEVARDYLFSEYQAEIVALPEAKDPIGVVPEAIDWGGDPESGTGTVYAPVDIISLVDNSARQTIKHRSQIPIYSAQNSRQLAANAWHLSVIDGGNPRGELKPANIGQLSLVSTPLIQVDARWSEATLDSGQWEAVSIWGDQIDLQHVVLGDNNAQSLAGDFNGDGVTDMAIFVDGYWFIDINGNGRWDEQDLWARMGSHEDQPVVGDWDGDGKDDIGVFGPQWPGDDAIVEREPGLPDAANKINKPLPKNIPPTEAAASRRRLLQKSSQGQVRADVVDHVFKFGRQNEIAVSGDWNGDGVSNIGTYRDGIWRLDLNGDGRTSDGDEVIQLGSSEDFPIVGDFDGDGIDELGIYRNGIWKIDLNGDRDFHHVDEVFQHGTPGDSPVVGDFDGDGVDDIAVYRANKAG